MRKLLLPLLCGAVLIPFVTTHPVRGQTTATPTATPIQPPPPPFGYTPSTPGPPPPPTGPATATPAPTATFTAVATATPSPLTLRLRVVHRSVDPGSKQKLAVTTLAAASLKYTVSFPDGRKKTHKTTASDSGTSSWSYVQPGSTITYASRNAKVTVVAKSGTQTKHSIKSYTIGFGPVDVSVTPRSQSRGKFVTVFAHTKAHAPVKLVFSYHGHGYLTIVGHPGLQGWVRLPYKIPNSSSRGTVDIYAFARWGGGVANAHTTFTVR